MNDSVRRTTSVGNRVARQIVRDRRSLALIIVGPTVMMGLVGLAIPDDMLMNGRPALDLLTPALIATFAMLLSFILTGVSFLRERTHGTMERLLASPIKKYEIVLGYLLGFILFGVIQAAVVSVFAFNVLGANHTGALWEIAAVEIIVVITGVNLGILASAFARNEFQVVQFIPLVITPQLILSGIFFRVEDMPGYLETIAHALPLMYAVRALRGVMLEGNGLASQGSELGVVAAFAVAFSIAAAIAFRKDL
jgi:ABC-2 type transport system permease protein